MFFGLTDVGKKREINEDYFVTYKIKNNIFLHIVADGLGGYNAGEVASKICAEKIIEYLSDKFDNINSLKNKDYYIKNILKKSVNYANEKIYEKEKTDIKYKGMGTTVVVILTIEKDIYYLSVGDSRIYYVDKEFKQIERVTEDDTYVNSLLKKNVITEIEAKEHTQRHVLTKAIGIFENIDIMIYKLNKTSGFILMCTDGVTNMIEDKELLEIIKLNKLEKISKEIINKANKNGGIDNSTALVISLNEDEGIGEK